MKPPPFVDHLIDVETERRLLHAFLVEPIEGAGLLKRTVRDGLRAGHFFRADHGQVFETVSDFVVRGLTPEYDLMHARLVTLDRDEETPEIGRVITSLLNEIYAADGYVSNAEAYARRLQDLTLRRAQFNAAWLITEGASEGNAEARERGLQMLINSTTAGTGGGTTRTREQLVEAFFERLAGDPPERFRWPWPTLNQRTSGGARRKEVVVLGGWTGGFKSVAYDESFLGFARQITRATGEHLRVHSYINEQTDETRMERLLANTSGVVLEDIATFGIKSAGQERKLDKVTAAANDFYNTGFGMTEANGWSAEEIGAHMMMHRFDVVGVDILHEIAHRDERDLAHIAQVLRSAAKHANCLLVMCVHLNDGRLTGAVKPVPVLRDVRGSGMIVRCADLVLFVHRHDDEDGDATDEGVLKVAKNRNGGLGSIDMGFDGFRMRMRELDRRWGT